MRISVCRGNAVSDKQGLGIEKPDDISQEDDEYTAYRKRMMLAYRFRPNPLVIIIRRSYCPNYDEDFESNLTNTLFHFRTILDVLITEHNRQRIEIRSGSMLADFISVNIYVQLIFIIVVTSSSCLQITVSYFSPLFIIWKRSSHLKLVLSSVRCIAAMINEAKQ